MRSINKTGVDLIKHWERFSSHIYLCPANIPTVGYGHAVSDESERARFKNGITKAEALELLKQDVRKAELAVLALIKTPLTENQFSALTSFCFNVGSGSLQRSTLRCVVNREEHDYVPQELAKWVYARGKKLQGLVLRRAAEAQLYMTH